MAKLLRLTRTDPSNFTQGPDGRLTGSVAEATKTATFDKLPAKLQPYARAGDKLYQKGSLVVLQHTNGSTHSMLDIGGFGAVGGTQSGADMSGFDSVGTIDAVPENAGTMATPALDAQVASLRANGWTNVDLAGINTMPAAAQTGVVAALTSAQAAYPAAEPTSVSVGVTENENALASTSYDDFLGTNKIILNQDYFGPNPPSGTRTLAQVGASSSASGFSAMPPDWNPSTADMAQYVTTHEMGHVVDNYSGYSASPAGSAYLYDALDSVSSYGETSDGENVAESFAVSTLDPSAARGDATAIFNQLTAAYKAKVAA